MDTRKSMFTNSDMLFSYTYEEPASTITLSFAFLCYHSSLINSNAAKRINILSICIKFIVSTKNFLPGFNRYKFSALETTLSIGPAQIALRRDFVWNNLSFLSCITFFSCLGLFHYV